MAGTAKETHQVTFQGIPSGDHECFCWAVDKETFTRITGEAPCKEFHENPFHLDLFSLYPNDVIGQKYNDEKVKMKFSIKITQPKRRKVRINKGDLKPL